MHLDNGSQLGKSVKLVKKGKLGKKMGYTVLKEHSFSHGSPSLLNFSNSLRRRKNELEEEKSTKRVEIHQSLPEDVTF